MKAVNQNNWSSGMVTFIEMEEFIEIYNRLDQAQKRKLSEFWEKFSNLPITPQKVASLSYKDCRELIGYAHLLLVTYCRPLENG